MAFNPGSALSGLVDAPMRPGRVVWIGLRPARRESVVVVEAATATSGIGLVGDHSPLRSDSRRQVTLIAAEHLRAIASFLGRDEVDPRLLRRNVVVSGINLDALKEKRFQIGAALLEYTGPCTPCSRMEEALGVGGYNAVRGHGGITTRVLTTGEIRIGDPLEVVSGKG